MQLRVLVTGLLASHFASSNPVCVSHFLFNNNNNNNNNNSMQTFLPYPDFNKSARVLDDKRLGKQRVECLQILQTLAKGPYQSRETILGDWKSCSKDEFDSLPKINTRRTPWYNHPAVRMWKGWECTLTEYAIIICTHWVNRGYKDTCIGKIRHVHYGTPVKCHSVVERQQGHNEYYTPWLYNPDFHAAHRSNLLRKDPTHYSQFGWTEPHNLPYIWPV